MARAQCGQLVFTKWHDKQDVAFLSTNVSPDEPFRPVSRIHNRQNVNIEKPRVSDVYTAHMGGVDRADQLRSFYCSGWQSKKWYRYIFCFFLMYPFVMLLFLNQNTLDRSMNRYISNLTSHSNITNRWFYVTKTKA